MAHSVMRTSRYVLLSLGMLILSVGAWAGECEPTYRRMGLETAEVGPLTVTASWVLIGCRAQLDLMGPKELAQAKALLATVVHEQAWGLMVFEKNVALRKTVTGRVNEAIGRAAVGDVLLLLQEIRE